MVKYSKEVRQFIFENYKGTGHKAMAEMVNKKFGTNVTCDNIKAFYHNNKLNSGITGRFEKNQIPWNKGIHYRAGGDSSKTRFKKGHIPVNHKEVGTERFSKDGYFEIKVAEPNKWKLKHICLYEKEFGKIPPKSALIFLDGDRTNVSLDNLKLISRAELLLMNRQKMFYHDAQLTEVSANIAKLQNAKNKKLRGRKENGK